MLEKSWENNGVRFEIAKTSMGHYCGYCIFPERPLIERGYSGIAIYVPVHGGITFSESGENLNPPTSGYVYGFDCAHCNDDSNPDCTDVYWLTTECEKMAAGIKVAAKYEQRFLDASGNDPVAKILDEMHKELGGFNLQDNFGAMIRVMCGSLK